VPVIFEAYAGAFLSKSRKIPQRGTINKASGGSSVFVPLLFYGFVKLGALQFQKRGGGGFYKNPSFSFFLWGVFFFSLL